MNFVNFVIVLYYKIFVMGVLQQINKWSATHHPRWLVVLRVLLGVALFIKGISFMRDSTLLESLLSKSNFISYSPWIALVITWLHLLGGFLVALGLLTRFAVLIQIPILVVAVLFVNQPAYNYPEFIFSLSVLLLLIFFFFEGGGPISADHYFKQKYHDM